LGHWRRDGGVDRVAVADPIEPGCASARVVNAEPRNVEMFVFIEPNVIGAVPKAVAVPESSGRPTAVDCTAGSVKL